MPSTRTRAEVRADLLAALRAGTTLRNGHEAEGVQHQVAYRSTRTRAQVAAEAREAVARQAKSATFASN